MTTLMTTALTLLSQRAFEQRSFDPMNIVITFHLSRTPLLWKIYWTTTHNFMWCKYKKHFR